MTRKADTLRPFLRCAAVVLCSLALPLAVFALWDRALLAAPHIRTDGERFSAAGRANATACTLYAAEHVTKVPLGSNSLWDGGWTAGTMDGSGALRLLTAAADGVYYQVFNDWEINYTDTMGRALVYAIDEQTGDARPVCSLPGCAHDSAACPAWSDGNVTLCYGDGDEVCLLLFYYNDETSYYRWERISADHTQRTVLATIEPGQSVVGRGVAVDDVNLYYSLLDEDNRHQTLWAVDTAGGQMQRIYTWDDLADGTGEYCPEMYTLLEVSGRQMTFAKTIQSTDARTEAIQICTVDLANGNCTPQ